MIEHLIRKHRGNPILLDANVLLLDIVGRLDPGMVKTFKRTAQFDPGGYDLLQHLLALFRAIVTTPNVLTEASNLGSQMGDKLGERFRDALRERITLLDERYLESAIVTTEPLYRQLGLSDAGLAMLAGDGLLVLTTDFPLANRLQHAGLDVINFNHLRTMAWQWGGGF